MRPAHVPAPVHSAGPTVAPAPGHSASVSDRLPPHHHDAEHDAKLGVTGWLISGATHLGLIVLLASIIIAGRSEKVDQVTTRVASIPPPQAIPPPNQPDPFSKTEPPTIPHDKQITSDETVINLPDSVIDIEAGNPDGESVVADAAAGRQDAKDMSEMGGPAFFKNIGVGEGGSGVFGKRKGPGKIGTLANTYGPHAPQTVIVIDTGLRWLARHQSANGMWDAANYFQNCADAGPKCEPGKAVPGANEAVTGYALLCFLGYGYDHRSASRYKSKVQRGLDYLLSIQQANGLIGTRNYEHAVCAMALAEAYGMTADPALKDPAQRAIDVILARQNQDPQAADAAYAGLGWDYIGPNQRNDSSVSGWNVMALKSGLAAGLDVKNGIQGSKAWLDRAWKAANPNWKTLDPYGSSVFPYTWNPVSDKADRDHLSFIGACAAVFLGHQAGDPLLETLLNDMDRRWLDSGAWKTNSYCIYYASMAAFQAGGKHWDAWMNAYLPWLNQTMNTDPDGGCLTGTWKYPAQSFHGGDTSRVLVHCYQLLALEVAVRYQLVQAHAKTGPGKGSRLH